MSRKPARPEPVQVVKERRDGALKALVEGCPMPAFWASASTGAATN